MRARPLLIFLHLPKTAGSTLASILKRQYGAQSILPLYDSFSGEEMAAIPPKQMDRLRVVIGHFYFGAHRFVSGSYQYVTLLRDPVDRVISHYQYARHDPNHYLYALASQVSLDEYVAACGAAEPNNDQTRLLAGTGDLPGSGLCTPEMLPVAKKNLRECFAVVGLTEEFDRSLILLKRVLDWRTPFYTRQNVSGRRPRKEQLPAETLRLIQAANALDRELYEEAREIFREQVRAQGAGYERELRSFGRLNSLYGASRRLTDSLTIRRRNA